MSNKNILNLKKKLNEEGKLFIKDLFRRNCDSLGQQRCTYMPFLYQKLSILLQNENFKMMSRRFKLSHELSKIRNSTIDGIPEIIQKDIEHSKSLQSIQIQDMDVFLKERKEESNIIFDNITTASSPQKDEKELESEYVISEYISQETDESKLDNFDFSNIAFESEKKKTKKEESDSEDDPLPKRRDKVKVKYSDGWYIGRVDSVSSKKTFFWVNFKGYDELYKVRRSDKFKII